MRLEHFRLPKLKADDGRFLMRHPEEIKNWGQSNFKLAQIEHERLQSAIRISDSFPWRYLSVLAGFIQFVLLALFAVGNHLFRWAHVDILDKDLAKAYFYVPEMAVQKKMELSKFIAADLSGKGVDLGCGSGIVGGLLIKHARLADLHGVDINEHNRSMAMEAGYSGFSAADIASIPLSANQFDYAISICVIEHVEELFDALTEVKRLVRVGGNFVFTTPNPSYARSHLGYKFRNAFGLHKLSEKYVEKRDLISMHTHIYSEEAWIEILRAKGFKNIEVSTFFSNRQSTCYDLLNWQVFFPWFYCCGKFQVIGFRWPIWAKFASWVCGHTAAFLTRPKISRGAHTHLFIRAVVSE